MAERRRAAADDGPAAHRPEAPARADRPPRRPRHRRPRLRHRASRTSASRRRCWRAARKRDFPLFEVPYELPFIAITERAFAQLLDERYEILQRNMAGDLLAEALSGQLYPEDLQARLRPFGIGEQVAVLAFGLDDPSAGAALVERILARERRAEPRGDPRRAGVRRGRRRAGPEPVRARAHDPRRARGALRRGPRRRQPARRRALAAHELPRGPLRARGGAPAQRRRARGRLLRGPRRLPAAALAAGRRRAQLLLPLACSDRSNRARASTATSSSARSTCSSSTTGTGRRRPRALFCHRHTLRYRIRRIEQLTGRDFSNARDRIEFWLALRGRELAR